MLVIRANPIGCEWGNRQTFSIPFTPKLPTKQRIRQLFPDHLKNNLYRRLPSSTAPVIIRLQIRINDFFDPKFFMNATPGIKAGDC